MDVSVAEIEWLNSRNNDAQILICFVGSETG